MNAIKGFTGFIDKKSAVKLINSYAESYKLQEEKIHFLTSKIQDLEANLGIKINLINSLMMTFDISQATQEIISQLNNEISLLKSENRRLSFSLDEAKSNVIFKISYHFI